MTGSRLLLPLLSLGLLGMMCAAPALAQDSAGSAEGDTAEKITSPEDLEGPESALVGDYPEKLELGDKVPDFVYRDIEGNTGRFSELVGEKKILLNFWATWCGPCKTELPALQLYHEQFSGEKAFEIVAVATDQDEVVKKVNKFKEKENLNFPLLADPDHSLMDYYVTLAGRKAWPTSYLIDEQGRVIKKHIGSFNGWGAVEEFITKPAETESPA